MSKYHAIRAEADGITFDSRKERDRYLELKLLEKAGKIHGLTLQPKFLLQEGFTNGKGEKVRSISYRADFSYTREGEESPTIEDVKGMKTPVYNLKKKLFERQYYPLTITEITD